MRIVPIIVVVISLLTGVANAGNEAPSSSQVDAGEIPWVKRGPDWLFIACHLGFANSLGRDHTVEVPQAWSGFDLAVSVHAKLGKLDVGVLGFGQGGLEAGPMKDGVGGLMGGGPTVGYTFGDGWFRVRPSFGYVVARSEHPLTNATSGWLSSELQVGFARTDVFRNPKNFIMPGIYFRVLKHVADYSENPDPHHLSMTVGFMFRAG